MKVALVSGIYGGFDVPTVPLEQTVPCDWIMVTDHEMVCDPRWQVIVEPHNDLHPRMAAKIPKCHPERYSDADVLIWIDGNLQVKSPEFVAWCLDHLGDTELCQHQGMFIDTFARMIDVSIAPKYQGQPIAGQVGHYLGSGFPPDWGVWWTGLIIRRRSCPDFGTPWLKEMQDWTIQDQISQPYVLWKMGLRPAPLEIEWKGFDEGSNHVAPNFVLNMHPVGWAD